MKNNVSLFAIMCVALAACVWMQPANAQSAPKTANQYTFYDVGTAGGTLSIFYEYDLTGGDFSPSAMNSKGDLAAIYLKKSTNAASFVWSNGKTTHLPSLKHAQQGGGGSNALGINDAGLVIGLSNDGTVSAFNHQLYNHAVVWTGRHIQRLPDLGGNDNGANAVNNSGLIAGYAFNSVADPYSYYGTQLHATTWLNRKITDLGTLGGTDSEAWQVNESGQVIGISFLDTPPKPPFNQPQDDAFLWSNGTMIDLGSLGGSFSTPSSINNSGQVSVISFDTTNTYIGSYLWSNGARAALNSLGGNYQEAVRLNDSATMIGWNSDASDTNALASLWWPDGSGELLGTVGTDSGSIALGINNDGVVVGGSGTITLSGQTSYAHAFVWQNGQMSDLNTLIPEGSSLTLNVAYDITDDGVIAGLGTNASGQMHAFILKPSGARAGNFRSAVSAPAAPGSSIRVPSPLEQIRSAARRLRETR